MGIILGCIRCVFVLGMLGFSSLEARRGEILIVHFVRLLRGEICNPAILREICLYVPDNYCRQREHRLLLLPKCRTNLPKVMTVGRAMAMLNEISPSVDIFHLSVNQLRQRLTFLLS